MLLYDNHGLDLLGFLNFKLFFAYDYIIKHLKYTPYSVQFFAEFLHDY